MDVFCDNICMAARLCTLRNIDAASSAYHFGFIWLGERDGKWGEKRAFSLSFIDSETNLVYETAACVIAVSKCDCPDVCFYVSFSVHRRLKMVILCQMHCVCLGLVPATVDD